MSVGIVAHSVRSQSVVNPPTPQQATYREGSFKGTYKAHGKECATAGVAFVSTANPGVHRVTAPEAARPSSSTAVAHVVNGKGTKFENVGFVVQTTYNQAHEPSVRVYPYAIKPGESGDFYHSGMSRCVRELVEQVKNEGVTATVDGASKRVAVREVSGESVVLDYFGDKPHSLRAVSDQRATLADISFSYRS